MKITAGGGCYGSKNEKYHTEYGQFADGIDYGILDEFCRVLKSLNLYIWCSKLQIFPLMKYFVEKKDCRFEILTWHKTNPIPTCNNKYLSDTEYCLFFFVCSTLGGTLETKGKYYISPINTADKDKFEHPTIKPMAFVKNHILNSTAENAVVLDPFAGSGTTLVAAKELGRQYIGFEIDEKWYNIAKNRLDGVMANGQLSMFLI